MRSPWKILLYAKNSNLAYKAHHEFAKVLGLIIVDSMNWRTFSIFIRDKYYPYESPLQVDKRLKRIFNLTAKQTDKGQFTEGDYLASIKGH